MLWYVFQSQTTTLVCAAVGGVKSEFVSETFGSSSRVSSCFLFPLFFASDVEGGRRNSCSVIGWVFTLRTLWLAEFYEWFRLCDWLSFTSYADSLIGWVSCQSAWQDICFQEASVLFDWRFLVCVFWVCVSPWSSRSLPLPSLSSVLPPWPPPLTAS